MFKKIATFLAAAALMLGVSAPAMAATYFGNDELIQIVYNTAGGTEVATDLGSINGSTFTANGSPSFLGSGGTIGAGGVISGGNFAGTNVSSLNVVYLAMDTNDTNNPLYFSSSSATAPTVQDGGAWGNTNSVLQAFYAGKGTQQVVVSTANALSYSMSLGGVNAGTFVGLLNPPSAESSLAALASGSAVVQKLYTTTFGATAQDLQLSISTNTDGTAGVVAATPIPPSFLLMGSGLLGMVGIRRKFTA